MDKNEDSKLNDEKVDQKPQAEVLSDEMGDVVRVNKEADVVIKKSGGGLALLLALLALMATAYLYYLDWHRITTGINNEINTVSGEVTEQQNELSTSIQALKDSHQVLKTDLINNQVAVTNTSQQFSKLQSDVETLMNEQQLGQSQSADNVVSPAFDNSLNEQSIEQLNNQLQAQSLLISQLQTQIQSQISSNLSNTTAEELLPEDENLRQKRLAVDMLYRVLMLVETQRLNSATETLDDFLQQSNIDDNSQRQLVQLNRQLKTIEMPDVTALKQQLQGIEKAIDQLDLTTINAVTEEDSWYSRLITVKKIENNEAINSTTKLLEFKATMNQLMLQAELFLSQAAQKGWSASLKDAASLLKNQFPDQQKLVQQLNQLSTQPVAIELPANLDIAALINQFKGLR